MKLDSEATNNADNSTYSYENLGASSQGASLKEVFLNWLETHRPQTYSPDLIEDCFEKTFEYLRRKKTCLTSLWVITGYNTFKTIYNTLVNDRFFRIHDRSNFKLFVRFGRLYSIFLEEKLLPQNTNNDDTSKRSEEGAPQRVQSVQTQSTPQLTIKEACISVLQNAKAGMTIGQIYKRIIAEKLYDFGARNPESVVRTEIERACENSDYKKMAKRVVFRIDRNHRGEKVYFALSDNSSSFDSKTDLAPDVLCQELKGEKLQSSKIQIWNNSIERDFRQWMESARPAPSAIKTQVYSSVIGEIVLRFSKLVDNAILEASTNHEAAGRFISLLNEDSDFEAIKGKNLYLAALASFARFIDHGSSYDELTVSVPGKASVEERLLPEKGKEEGPMIAIWDASIKRDFRDWLVSEHYSPSTANVYCSSINQATKRFKVLADLAISSSSTTREAARQFVSLVQKDGESPSIRNRNPFCAALAAFARFIDADSSPDMPAKGGTREVAIDDTLLPKEEKAESPELDIWNKSIESDFRAWMKTQNYASSTRNVYSGTMKQIAQHFLKLSDTAVCKSTTMEEAACTFIKLLRQDPEFAAMSAKKSQFSSSLAAFERFVGSQSSDFSSEAIHTNRTKTDNRYESGKTDSGSSKIEIWNKSIEHHFRVWMEIGKYTSSSIDLYCGEINQIFKKFEILRHVAGSKSSTLREAAHYFITLLKKYYAFSVTDNHKRNQVGNVLDTFARFVDSDESVSLTEAIDSSETTSDRRPVSKKGEKPEPHNILIWSKSIKKRFRNWLELEHYSPSTANVYCSSINQATKRFKVLQELAISSSSTTREAARQFVSLVQKDGESPSIRNRNPFCAALAAFARFIDADSSPDMPAKGGTREVAIDDTLLPKEEKAESPELDIWNKSIESDFRAWMKTQNYASSTRNVYSGTMKQIAQHFLKLSDTAVCKSTTMEEAACTFIKLLRQDPEFAAISAKKSQFSSSLAAFERFVGSQSSDFSSEAIHTNRTKTDNRYESGKTDSGSSKIELWNKSIERDFLTWMRKKNYASSNRKLNRFYVEMIMDDFNTLADQATRESETMPEAARKFTFLLRRSREFEAKASVSHKFGAALAVYAEFVDSGDYVLSSDSPDSKETNTNKRRESKVNEGLKSKVADILFKNFKNGFRLDSLIELIRFRHFYADASGEEIDLSDEELKRVISACGYLFGGKVYIVSAEIKSKIKRNVDETFESGARMIFYEVFYEKNEDWLFPGRIVSVEMLEDIFRRLFRSSSGYIHKKNYISKRSFTRDELTMIKTEILRVWEKDVLVSYSQLAERLPYIPFEKIRYALAYNSDFVRNSDGVYTHISKVDITGEERSRIANFVAERCVANGYASMNDIPLDEIEERNHELTTTAIQNAAFQISLSDKYDKKGRIVTHKGGTLNALTIMKDYCRKLDKCSLDDLLSFQEELVGQRENQSTAMEAAYTILVRVQKNTFLAEKYFDFNTSEIDNAIALFVKGDYLPLKSFTTFVAFPHCGQPWNLFLLESYCRRFSERFRFDTLSINSRNAGAVIRRSCRLTYLEIMADAVVRSNIPYEEKSVGGFLFEKGYTGKTSTVKASEIIERVKTIRERKD